MYAFPINQMMPNNNVGPIIEIQSFNPDFPSN